MWDVDMYRKSTQHGEDGPITKDKLIGTPSYDILKNHLYSEAF